jgi:NTE family protein
MSPAAHPALPHAGQPAPPVGLILTGGGARAAYQVGVLKAIAEIAGTCQVALNSPFQVIAGTSAGAINASALACGADDFQSSVRTLVEVWENFSVAQVYRADSLGVIRTGAPWLTMMSLGWLIARWKRVKPRSLLDNSPLQGLLQRMIPFERLPDLMAQGHLQALAVTASSYSSGEHVTFYDSSNGIQPWARHRRQAVRTRLSVPHLLASAAIPFLFPSIPLAIEGRREWFGDGSMRQVAPISPAVHLGAQRILIIGAGRMHEPPGREIPTNGYPSVAQIAGHALSNIFLDALAADVERLQRINTTLALLTPEARALTPLRPIDALVIAPSQRLDDIAARHIEALPITIRALLGAIGVGGEGHVTRGAALSSYLLFEAAYTRDLIELGMADTHARRDAVLRFFSWSPTAAGAAESDATRQAQLTSCLP